MKPDESRPLANPIIGAYHKYVGAQNDEDDRQLQEYVRSVRDRQQRKADEIRTAVENAIKETEANRRVCWDRDTIRNLNRVR